MKKLPNKIIFVISAIISSLIFVSICVTSIEYKSPTRDENKHLIRGIILLETGDFRLNKHHPYLVNVIDSIPSLFDSTLKIPSTESENWETANKDAMAGELITLNGGDREFTKNILNPARYMNIAITTLLILIAGFLIYNEFGIISAVIFNFLYFLSPNIIAHTRLVTTDAFVTPLVLISTMCLYKYLKNNSWKWLISFIFLSFFSLLTKYSVVPIAFFWILSLWINRLSKNKKSRDKWIFLIKQTLIIAGSWILMLTAAYGFQFKTLVSTNYADQHKIDAHLSNIAQLESTAPGLVDPLRNFYLNTKVPFAEYLQGFLENVIFHDIYGHESFLFGMYSNHGWWYYFPSAFVVKVPEPIIILTVILFIYGIVEIIKKAKHKEKINDLIKSPKLTFFIVPILILLLSLKSSINLGLRHILIIFPFIYLAIAIFIPNIIKQVQKKALTVAIILLGLWYAVASFSIYPNYLEYFNSISGGPSNGHFYLLDSNLSWGQNDFLVEDYIQNLFGTVSVSVNPSQKPNTELTIVDVDSLMGRHPTQRNNLSWLREPYLKGTVKPIDSIANTHLVFDLNDDKFKTTDSQ